jgi:hypothetical protein
LNTPSGAPARWRISAIAHAEAGTRSAGLSTTVLPYASAGATFQAGIASGKFQGVIRPTTPSGSRRMSTSTPGRTDGTRSPARRNASPAKNLKICPARPASAMPSASGLPSSRESSSPSSCRRLRISSPAASSRSKRCCGVLRAHLGKADRAAAIACSASARSARP